MGWQINPAFDVENYMNGKFKLPNNNTNEDVVYKVKYTEGDYVTDEATVTVKPCPCRCGCGKLLLNPTDLIVLGQAEGSTSYIEFEFHSDNGQCRYNDVTVFEKPDWLTISGIVPSIYRTGAWMMYLSTSEANTSTSNRPTEYITLKVCDEVCNGNIKKQYAVTQAGLPLVTRDVTIKYTLIFREVPKGELTTSIIYPGGTKEFNGVKGNNGTSQLNTSGSLPSFPSSESIEEIISHCHFDEPNTFCKFTSLDDYTYTMTYDGTGKKLSVGLTSEQCGTVQDSMICSEGTSQGCSACKYYSIIIKKDPIEEDTINMIFELGVLPRE